jgi:hypothetical protein
MGNAMRKMFDKLFGNKEMRVRSWQDVLGCCSSARGRAQRAGDACRSSCWAWTLQGRPPSCTSCTSGRSSAQCPP